MSFSPEADRTQACVVFIVCCFPRDWLQVMDKIYFSNYISRGWDTYIGFPSCHAYMDREISKKANYQDVSIPTNFVKYLSSSYSANYPLQVKLFRVRRGLRDALVLINIAAKSISMTTG